MELQNKLQDLLNELQEISKIPLLIAANCDAGGNGARVTVHTSASGAQCEASGDTSVISSLVLSSGRGRICYGCKLEL